MPPHRGTQSSHARLVSQVGRRAFVRESQCRVRDVFCRPGTERARVRHRERAKNSLCADRDAGEPGACHGAWTMCTCALCLYYPLSCAVGERHRETRESRVPGDFIPPLCVPSLASTAGTTEREPNVTDLTKFPAMHEHQRRIYISRAQWTNGSTTYPFNGHMAGGACVPAEENQASRHLRNDARIDGATNQRRGYVSAYLRRDKHPAWHGSTTMIAASERAYNNGELRQNMSKARSVLLRSE